MTNSRLITALARIGDASGPWMIWLGATPIRLHPPRDCAPTMGDLSSDDACISGALSNTPASSENRSSGRSSEWSSKHSATTRGRVRCD